jgi:hypothetical protein
LSDGTEKIVFGATIDAQGRIHPDAANATAGRLAKWRGRHVTVSVARYVKSKTNPQLALFHGPILEAWAEWCGYDPADMKRELKLAYLAPQLAVARLTGEEKEILPSLADLNVEEMSTFLERVLREGRMLGITFALDESSG